MDTSMQPAGFTNALEYTSAALVLCSVARRGPSPAVEVIEANPASYRLCRAADRAGLEAILAAAIAAGDSATEAAIDAPGPSGPHERTSFEYTMHGESANPVHVMVELVVVSASRESSTETMIYLKDITPGRTLQKELGWLSALPEANPNIVLIMGCPDRIEYVNATGRAWLEHRGSESWDDLRGLLPDDYGETICAACDRSDRLNWTIQFDGHDYDVRKTSLPDGERCMITVNDVTEFRELSRRHEVFFQAFRSSHTPILITADTKSTGGGEMTLDFYANGVFIETSQPFEKGQEVALCFTFSEAGETLPFKIKGYVSRVYADGIGVHYAQMTHYRRDILNTLIHKIC